MNINKILIYIIYLLYMSKLFHVIQLIIHLINIMKNLLYNLKVSHSEYEHLDRNTVDKIIHQNKNIKEKVIVQNPEVELIWGGSGIMLVYQMGLAHYINKHFGYYNNEESLNYYKFSGMSGGAATAGFMMASVYGIGDMAYWYNSHVRKLVIQSSSGFLNFFGKWTNLIWLLAYDAYRICQVCGLNNEVWNSRFRIFVTKIEKNSIKTKRIKIFNNPQTFADAICSTTFIPFLFSEHMVYKSSDDDSNIIDGSAGFILNDLENITKNNLTNTIYFTFDHYSSDEIEIIRDNMTVINICPEKCNPLTFIWRYQFLPIHSLNKSDDLFKMGYEWGEKNHEILSKYLKKMN